MPGYVVVVCKRCRKPFIKEARWKRVRCPYCGETNSTEGHRVFEKLEDARAVMRQILGI